MLIIVATIPVVENPIAQEVQEYNRYRFWGEIEELDGKILRVVTLEDKKPYTMLSRTGGLRSEVKSLRFINKVDEWT